MSKDPYCSMCIFASDEGIGSDRSCTRCQMVPGRPNFISIYKDGRKPKVEKAPRESKGSIRRTSNERISILVKKASKGVRSLGKRRMETWMILTCR